MYHVTSTSNRSSIFEHGLDWTRMGVARGIAGSREPEQRGCFVCLGETDVEFFVRINNTGGAIDVWGISGVDETELVESPEGFWYVPRPIPPENLTLVRQGVQPST